MYSAAGTCFNAADESFACVGLTGGAQFTESPPCIGAGVSSAKNPRFWNGTLLLFNGSKTSRSIGVLQTGSSADYGHFDSFVAKMKQVPIVTNNDGTLIYRALSGDELRFGQGGAIEPVFEPLANSYSSPYIHAAHEEPIAVILSFPGLPNETLHFDESFRT